MLEFRDVWYQYAQDALPTLQGLSFSVERGAFVCIVGPSGCGKSTIFRLIGQLLLPQRGRILVDGRDVAGRKGYCGYMPQDDLLLPWRTVAENLRLPLEVRGGLTKPEMERRVQDALTAVGLEGWGARATWELSGGMRQRAAFARTLLTGSELLLLDEPFSALDYLTRLTMRQWLLEQWQRERKTVLFVTHDVEEAVFLAQRVLVASASPIRAFIPLDVPASPEGKAALKAEVIAMLQKGAA